MQGIEEADSITFDCHKWPNIAYDNGVLFINQKHTQHQLSVFNSSAIYMSQVPDEPMNKGIENSRALRALPVWVSLQAYGREGYTELVEANCQFAEAVSKLISEIDAYEVLAPVHLNIVLFRGRNIVDITEHQKLVAAINATGKIFITGTSWLKQPAMRIAVCNWQTSIELDLSAVKEALLQGFTHYMKQLRLEA